MGRLGGVRPAAPARVATALDLTTRSRGEVSDTFEGLAHRSGAREMLGQRGACNGPGTRPARMGKASQSIAQHGRGDVGKARRHLENWNQTRDAKGRPGPTHPESQMIESMSMYI